MRWVAGRSAHIARPAMVSIRHLMLVAEPNDWVSAPIHVRRSSHADSVPQLPQAPFAERCCWHLANGGPVKVAARFCWNLAGFVPLLESSRTLELGLGGCAIAVSIVLTGCVVLRYPLEFDEMANVFLIMATLCSSIYSFLMPLLSMLLLERETHVQNVLALVAVVASVVLTAFATSVVPLTYPDEVGLVFLLIATACGIVYSVFVKVYTLLLPSDDEVPLRTWQESSSCSRCAKTFGMLSFGSKNHCRLCGCVICANGGGPQ